MCSQAGFVCVTGATTADQWTVADGSGPVGFEPSTLPGLMLRSTLRAEQNLYAKLAWLQLCVCFVCMGGWLWVCCS